MLALELSSYFLLAIPNDAYTTPSQFLLAFQHSVERALSAYWLMLENYEKATLNIDMPYWAAI